MLWTALLLPPSASQTPSSNLPGPDALAAVAVWALQFTPRVAVSEDAVLMEVGASTRLFGGKRALRDRVVAQAKELGVAQVAWATTALGAHALARCGIENGFKKPLGVMLDALPMACLSAVRPHATTLAQAGCRTLGDVRALPRGGLSRRFDKQLLQALDRAYGHAPEVHAWEALPDTFHARLELPFRVEHAPALLQGARRLLVQMCGWLAARHAGVTAFTLRWWHDAMRAKDAGEGGSLSVGTADPSRDVEHLCRLLAEHLAKVALLAPAGDLALTADQVHDQAGSTAALLPGLPGLQDAARDVESLHLVLERMAARLGPEAVRRCVTREDHRQEWMGHWQPAAVPPPRKLPGSTSLPQPTWVLPEPLKLAVRKHRPVYQGELQLLAGPQCVEAGWWDRDDATDEGRLVVRDYWLAESRHAGLLWIFQARLDDGTAWFLHGVFG
ncbi:Y-family DNA polymerase [Roseateles chitinivorans]|uniref:Y-family DNA polymerase n=1 Tax=Roseateles chitinivorans TaxID=2917965 RepID=UPI003D677A3C